MISLKVSDRWRETYPQAAAGLLAVRRAANPKDCPELNQPKKEVEETLKASFADREAIKSHPLVAAYNAYYKKFKKTYHLLNQVESIALKGKSIPRVAALVEAMFMAELKNLLLTAGHDRQAVQGLIRVDVAAGGEEYLSLSGRPQRLKAQDMFMADGEGVISSVLYGPDERTRITPTTTEAVFTVYAPPGVGAGAVRDHLEDLAGYVRLISPKVEVESLEVHQAG